MNTYQQAVLKARKQFLRLNKSQEKELLNLYTELAKQLESDISKCRTTSKELYLKKLHNIVVANIRDMHGDLKKIVTDNIITSSEIASSADYAYYEAITKDTGLLTTFNSMILSTREKTVKKLIQGKFYKDKTSLSQRLWNLENNNIKSIDIAIKTNVLRGANARELAKNLEKYVNPKKRLEIKTDAVGFNKDISYNASRLARTSITHSFSETMINNAMNNPFNKGLKWNLSASHSARMHGKTDMCDDNAGKVFAPEEIPLQHPCCLCFFTEENISISEASKRLKVWSEGAEDKDLDKWYEKNKSNSELKDSLSDIIKRRKNVFKPAKNIKTAESFAKNVLEIKNVSYKGCDIETANEWNRGLFDSFKKFPELKDNFGFVGECHERNKHLKPVAREYYLKTLIKDNPKIANKNMKILEEYAEKQVKILMRNVAVSKNTFAQSWSPVTEEFKQFKGVTVNKVFGKDSEIFKEALLNNVESKFHPVGCETIRSVLDHEIGHQLDDLLNISSIDEVKELYDSRTKMEITEQLSEYSWNNSNSDRYSEFIAEAWSEYCNNAKPRFIAKTVGEIIERVYDEWKKKSL